MLSEEDLEYIELCREELETARRDGEEAWLFNHEDSTWECKANYERFNFYSYSAMMMENLLDILEDIIRESSG